MNRAEKVQKIPGFPIMSACKCINFAGMLRCKPMSFTAGTLVVFPNHLLLLLAKTHRCRESCDEGGQRNPVVTPLVRIAEMLSANGVLPSLSLFHFWPLLYRQDASRALIHRHPFYFPRAGASTANS